MTTEDITTTLAERGKRYGKFAANASGAQLIKEAFRDSPNWPSLALYQKEALEMIATKISRILTGDPNYDDNWRDIAGYAMKVVEILTEPRP